MKSFLCKILLFSSVLLTSVTVLALNLPVKRVGNIEYYCYTVGNNESIAEIAGRLGITRDELLRTNPGASDGLRAGMVLYFPVAEFSEYNRDSVAQNEDDFGVGEPIRYKVQRGETLYGIAHRFEMTPEEIIALNPSARAGIKGGDILLIAPRGAADRNQAYRASEPPAVPAVRVMPQVQPIPEVQPSIEGVDEVRPACDTIAAVEPAFDQRLRPVNIEGTFEPATVDSDIEDAADVVDGVAYETSDTAVVSLMLPLMLNENTDSKMHRQSIDFVRGFMLGIHSMESEALPTIVNVFDTQSDAERMGRLLADNQVKQSNIIIAHDEGAGVAMLPSYAINNEVYMLNLFASHDTTYLKNPYFLQSNIPAQLMYEKAAQALLATYKGYRPVFLASKGGRGEKVPFTNYVRQVYREIGVEPIEMVYDGMLTSADFDNFDLTGRYVFIPASGSLTEFNKFAQALTTIRNYVADPSAIGLFGYPDWTTFRGESLDLLHRLNATIYSRFYCDEQDYATQDFIGEFERAYGCRPLEQVPSQALLGYDSARYLLRNFADNDGVFNPASPEPFRGVQSTFMLVPADDDSTSGGFVNTALYIITYKPGAQVIVKVI